MVLALTGAGFFAGNAAAQEATLMYSTQQQNAVSIGANTTLLFVGETAGSLTVTVFGMTGTLTNDNFVPKPGYAPSRLTVTLFALSSCDITNGCDAFGLENANNANARASVLAGMNLLTLSMFIASGADLNEEVNNDYLLIYSLASATASMQLSALVATAGGGQISI